MTEYQSAAAIITAVEVETRAIKNLYKNWDRIKIHGDEQEYFGTSFRRGEKEFRLVTAQQEVMGMVASSLLCSKIISNFHPKYLILCGITAGIGKGIEQIYGDIIVPDVVWDYTTGKFVGSNEAEIRFGDLGFLPRPVSLETDGSVLKIIRRVQTLNDNDFHVHIGPMACGSSVVANSMVVKKQIHSLFPETAGLDMESYSVVYAAKNFLSPRPKAIIIKSICDYADEEKSDKYQKFAAFNSGSFAKYLLDNHLPL